VTQPKTTSNDALFSTDAMMAVLREDTFFAEMLHFEVCLASALESNALIPPGTALALSNLTLETLDLSDLPQKTSSSGNPCIPFVNALTKSVAALNPAAAAYVHWGATSQDVIDTALLMQWRRALNLIETALNNLCVHLAQRIREYRNTVMPGRTWLQQAPPVTLGYKFATWLDALHRHRERLAQMKPRVFTLQFGGAVGTLAPYRHKGKVLAENLADLLLLNTPDIPWHTQRDRIGEFASNLALLVGTLGKIGRDVSLLMQSEVGEFTEAVHSGQGGSSTMPHKRNPVSSAVLLSVAMRVPALASTIFTVMPQEHERGLGGWQAEWETIPEILRLTAGALQAAISIAEDGSAIPSAMQHNLFLLKGVPMAEAVSFALAEKIGKAEAHGLLEETVRRVLESNSDMLKALQSEPEITKHLTSEELNSLLQPENYLGSTQAFIDAVLADQDAWSTHAGR
jgi:3-carboxy-cis,cis-muconate cycloisomerase